MQMLAKDEIIWVPECISAGQAESAEAHVANSASDIALESK
jgi:hypothetical protein